jgi:hypothetical protein
MSITNTKKPIFIVQKEVKDTCQHMVTLKGQSHEIFDLWFFFRQTVPLGPLIHGLKRFCI